MIGSVLIVDDEVPLTGHLETLLKRAGYHTAVAHDPDKARQQMARHYPDIVLMDLRLGEHDGGELIEELKLLYPESQFIIITAHGSIRSAVECSRRGAVDYLTKPFDLDDLLLTLSNTMNQNVLADELRRLRRSAAGGLDDETDLICHSRAMEQTLAFATRAADQEGIVLLLGESGVGKDYLAQWIHSHSRRAPGPFFSVNCAALPRDLAESELFGHEPGAFTGTRGRKRGLLELAEKGTLLLNEVGELDPAIQSKLLSVLDTRSFLRVGGERSISIEARIFAATNRDLAQDVKSGAFREDLFYRLNVFPIEIPPLRQRRADITDLARRMLERISADMGLRTKPAITAEALAALKQYDWPGNIRELRNQLERAVIFAGTDPISPVHLNLAPTSPRHPELGQTQTWDFHEARQQLGRNLIREALRQTQTKQQAARLLGLSRHALTHQMTALEIDS